MGEDNDRNRRLLKRIADALGIPVERFSSTAAPEPAADGQQILLLWSALRTDAGRAAALAALRRILDEEDR